MRCAQCRSYIPEGLAKPVICPTCGRVADDQSAEPKIEPKPRRIFPIESEGEKLHSDLASMTAQAVESESLKAKSHSTSSTDQSSFAPYFTLTARFSFGLPNQSPSPSEGTISFGESGFSFVCDQGRRWEKILYRDLDQAQLKDNAVSIIVRDIESRLVFYHPWLPTWLSKSASKSRAIVFLELLSRVKNGLTSFEIKMYQRRIY